MEDSSTGLWYNVAFHIRHVLFYGRIRLLVLQWKISKKVRQTCLRAFCKGAITQVVCVLKWKTRGMQGQRANNTKQAGRLAPCWAPGEWASSPAMQRSHQTNSTDNLNQAPQPRSPTQPGLRSDATRELSPSITRLFKRTQTLKGEVKKHIFRLWKHFESVLVTMYNYRFSNYNHSLPEPI